MKIHDKPYFKDEFNIVKEMGKIRIIDNSKERIQYQPLNITKVVYVMLCCMDGRHTNEEILELLEKKIKISGEELKHAYEKVLIMLGDYIEFNTSKSRRLFKNTILDKKEVMLYHFS